MSLKLIRNLSIGLAFLVIVFASGYNLGFNQSRQIPSLSLAEVSGKSVPDDKKDVDFSLFWEVWRKLETRYIDKSKVKPQEMIYGAISGMVSSLNDPYTVFLPPEKNKQAKDDLGGKFEGIGAQLGVENGRIVVVAPLKGAPAEEAGLKAGDIIVSVDGQETADWTLPEAVANIRGPKGSAVVLTVIHKGQKDSVDISIIRDTIKVPSVEWEWKFANCTQEEKIDEGSESDSALCQVKDVFCEDCSKVIYLKLSRFGDTTTVDWTKAIESITEEIGSDAKGEIKGLVFDLRNNPGGYLSGSVFIASEFLDSGVVVEQEFANGRRETFNVEKRGRLLNIPMVVLINRGSASASEIVAGALRASNRARLVGERSFGKGTIQEAQELPDGAGIHITTAKWYLPNGEWVDEDGVEPDVIIENGEGEEKDKQLEKAIEILASS